MVNKRTRNSNPPKQCTVAGCTEKHLARGYCNKHWKRWKRHGTPTGGYTGTGEAMAYIEKLLSQPKIDTCITWPYSTHKSGHGVCYPPDRAGSVHVSRYLMEQREPRPSKEHLALHSCHKGHEACVNPEHLYWGTQADNTRDMLLAGRHPTQKITAETAQEIWNLKGTGTATQIAAKFPGASKDIVQKIWAGLAWVRHISQTQ